MSTLHAVFAAVVLGGPVLFFAVVAWLVRRDKKRLVAHAERFACTQCGTFIAEAGVDRADTLWFAHMQKLMVESPHVRFRVVRTLHGACPSCGACYQFVPEKASFVPVRFDRNT